MINNVALHIFCIYIPPKTSSFTYERFFDALSLFVSSFSNVIILGDFNVPTFVLPSFVNNTSNKESQLLHNFLFFTGFEQFNDTRNSHNRLLDLVMCSNEQVNCRVIRNNCPFLREDLHHPTLIISVKVKHIKRKETNFSDDVKLYNFKKADFLALYEALTSMDWSKLFKIKNVNLACSYFYKQLYSVLDKFVPVYKRAVKKYPKWFSSSLIKKLKKKERLHKKFKKSQLDCDYLKFATIRSEVNELKKTDYKTYTESLQFTLQKDPKKF